MRLRAPGPPSGADGGIPPPGLFDGHVVTRMVGFIEPGDPPSGSAAFRRLKEAQREWLAERGYLQTSGDVDWFRFRADFNRPAYYGGPRPGSDRQAM